MEECLNKIREYSSPNYELLLAEMRLILERVSTQDATLDDRLFLKEKLSTLARLISMESDYLASKFNSIRTKIIYLDNDQLEESIWLDYITSSKSRINLENIARLLISTIPRLSNSQKMFLKLINIMTLNTCNRHKADSSHITLPKIKPDGNFAIDLNRANTAIAIEVLEKLIS